MTTPKHQVLAFISQLNYFIGALQLCAFVARCDGLSCVCPSVRNGCTLANK